MGRDPATARDAAKEALTIAELGRRFLDEYVPVHCKQSTANDYGRAVEFLINPELGRIKIPDLVRADVSRFHHAFRSTPYQANRALSVLSKMLNLAEVWGLRLDGSNPCRHIKRYKEKKRKRYLNGDELERLGLAQLQSLWLLAILPLGHIRLKFFATPEALGFLPTKIR